MRHIVNYRSANDTGFDDEDAIQPVSDGEAANQTIYRRPTENLRVRTEVLRELVREHIVLADYNRGGIAIWGGGDITFNGAYAGGSEGVISFAETIYLAPFATAGGGASAPYIVSTKASLTIGTASTNQMTFESVKKQWEGSTFPEADANAISVEIVHTGAASITVTVTGATGEENNIKAEIDFGTHTCQELKDALDAVSDVTDLITTTIVDSAGATAPKWDETDWADDYSERFLKGGSAGAAHELPASIFATFFATDDNKLRKGDTLAVAYDKNIDKTSTGGRFQSTAANANTVLTAGQLFNTRREPERIANSIPICKCIDDDYILFVNGAQIKNGVPATLSVDSDTEEGIGEVVSSEIVSARTSDLYGAFGTLDGRLEAGDTEVSNARTSTYYNSGAPYATLDERIEASDAEINTARTSTVYGAQADLDARVEQYETEIETARDGEASLDARLTILESGGGGGFMPLLAPSNGDYSDIEAAFAALNAANGGRLFIRKGTYTLTGNLTATKPISLIGTDENVVIDIGSYTLTLADQVRVSGVEVQGTGNLTCGDTTLFRGCSLTCGLLHTGARVVYQSCTFAPPSASNIELSSGENITFSACRFSLDHSTSVFRLDDSKGVTFTSCSFATSATGDSDAAFLECASSAAGERVVFRRCSFDLSGTSSTSGAYIAIDDFVGPVMFFDCDITAKTTLASTKPIFTLNTRALVDGLRIDEKTADQISLTGYLDVAAPVGETCDIRRVEVNPNNAEIRAYPVLHFRTYGEDAFVHAKDFSFSNIRFPTGASGPSEGDSVVQVTGNSANAKVLLEQWWIRDVRTVGSSDTFPFTLLSSTSSECTFRQIHVHTNFTVASTGNDICLFNHLSSNTIIEECEYSGESGSFLDYLVNLGYNSHPQHATVRRCRFVHSGVFKTGSNGLIHMEHDTGGVFNAYLNITHNTIIDEGTGSYLISIKGATSNELYYLLVSKNKLYRDGGACVEISSSSYFHHSYNLVTQAASISGTNFKNEYNHTEDWL